MLKQITLSFESNSLKFENLRPLLTYTRNLNSTLFSDQKFLDDNFENLRYFYEDLHFTDEKVVSMTSYIDFSNRIRFYHISKLFQATKFITDILLKGISLCDDNVELTLKNESSVLYADKVFLLHLIHRIQAQSLPLSIHSQNPNLSTMSLSPLSFNESKDIESLEINNTLFFDSNEISEKILIQQFENAMNIASYEDAIKLAKAYLFMRPNDYETRMYFGLAYVLSDQPELGEKEYQIILNESSDPSLLADTYYCLGMLYMRHHHREQLNSYIAAQYLEKGKEVIEKNKEKLGNEFLYKWLFNRNGRALIEYKNGNLQTAYEYCDDGQWQLFLHYGKDHFMHRTVLMYNCVLTCTAMGNMDSARLYSDMLLTVDPNYADYWLKRSNLLHRPKTLDKSLAAATRAVELNPYEDGYLIIRSILLHEVNRDEEAIIDLERAIELNPLNEDAYTNLSAYFLDQHQETKVLDLYKNIDLTNNVATANNVSVAYSNLGKTREAIKVLTAVAKNDTSGDLYSNIATYYDDLGDYDNAREYIEKALQLDHNDHNFLYIKTYLLNKYAPAEMQKFVDSLSNDLEDISFLGF